jgi:glucokinase
MGVDIGGSTVRLALADLSGAIIGQSSSGLRSDRSPKAVTSIIAAGIRQLSRDYNVPEKKILAIAAGAPGITDVAAGQVLSAPNLTGWHKVPLRDLLRDKTGIPSIVENDVNLAALGESWRGAARDVANFVFLAIGTGAGAGVVLDGRLHHGAAWSAGEIGYMMLPGLSSEAPAHLRLGALESVIGGKPIEQAWAQLNGASKSGKKLTATKIFDLAGEGNTRAREVLSRTAAFLAMAITNLGLVLDLSLVVLGGGVGSHPALVESTRRALADNEFARPHVAVSSLGPAAQIYGAIWLALQTADEHGFRRGGVRRRRAGVSNS